ncbi:MAG: Asp23/Gls24 family envelope stress response protein, partial [Rubrobacter sp.]
MSEPDQTQNESPLVSERGVTTISAGVVSQLAGMAAQEVEGIHMGGSASRTAGGLLGSVTGSESQTRGVSVEVGRVETAIDLKLGVEYGTNILQSVDDVRSRIIDRIQNITGLRVTELNVTVADITFPEKEQKSRLSPTTSTQSLEAADDPDTEPVTTTAPSREDADAERETTEVAPGNETLAESEPVPEEEVPEEEVSEEEIPQEEVPQEEVRVEDRPPEGDETAELRPEGTASGQGPEQPADAETDTTAEAETRAEADTTAETRTGEAEA